MRRGQMLSAALIFCLSLLSPAQQPAPAKPHTPARAATSTPHTGIPSSWSKVPIPKLHQFKPQEPRRVVLPNGLILFLQEDHELPLINGVIRLRGGSRDEPADKTGLTDIYGEVWRTGGTHSKTGDQLDDLLESQAARVETSNSIDSTFLSWSSLKDDFDRVFPVILDVLENPEFREDKIELAKRQMDSLISRRNDDADDIVHREAAKLAYGPENPYARTPEYYTVSAVTRQDLMAWHKRTVAPSNMIMGVTGDFDAAAMERRIRETLGNLPKGEPFPRTKIDFHDPNPGVYFVEKDDVNQSNISMVALGIERRNPDYYALVVMNELFGGGFSSRLFENIRTKEGLAYSVGGGVGTAFDHPGMLRIGMATKSGTTARAIDALNKQIAELIKGGVTEKELKKAKDAILNSFIFEFDSKDKVLAERMRYEFYGYPPNFLELFRAGIEKVTPADVDRVAKKYVHPEKLAVLVVGNSKDFDRDLKTFGKVTQIDISIPQKKPGM
ncbi:MAG TPA: pitrilysin family protein [Candidatus Limnocylindrales bacterium]|nr:pitrilysin family protein [Candidatus Limnocylindrales bacterium]